MNPGFERARALMSAAGINTGTDPGRTACEVLAALLHAADLAPETGPAPVLAWVGAHEWQEPAHLLAKHRDAPGAERAAWVLALTRAAVPEHRERTTELIRRALTHTSEENTVIDPHAPAVSTEDGDAPTEDELRAWADAYVPAESAAAWAEHVYVEWENYEPDGSLSVEQFLCDLMRSWRGEDGGYPPTPAP